MRWPGFALAANGSTVRTEMLAGATTFLTMAYIVFVNPDILATTAWITARCSWLPAWLQHWVRC